MTHASATEYQVLHPEGSPRSSRRWVVWGALCATLWIAMIVTTRKGKLNPPPVDIMSVDEDGVTADSTPVALMHGMADSSDSEGMRALAASLQAYYPRKFVISLSVSDGLASILRPMPEQVDEFARVVRGCPDLAGGFDAIGFSQGGLLIRAYVERYNSPPVRRFVSVCSPQEGVGVCPLSPIFQWLCPIWRAGAVHATPRGRFSPPPKRPTLQSAPTRPPSCRCPPTK